MTADSRREREGRLSVATRVQQLLLPASPPACGWSCIGVRNSMAEGLGGDFYDFVPTVDGCQAVMIGDVVGHGTSAALVMGLLYGYIHSRLQTVCSVHQVVERVNAFLKSFAARTQTDDHLFSATLFFGIIDPQSLKLEYLNAGHPPPLVRRGDQVLTLDATTHPLGFFDIPESSTQIFQFQKGDRWLLYTDGMIETADVTGSLFGANRLRELLLSHNGDHLQLLDNLMTTVNRFRGSDRPDDDCTAIAIDFHRMGGAWHGSPERPA
ncbi:MAG: PP2C family protein-serine/threonine phosphatase [Desulfuromonadales bacterium]|nr:PP2C family protein-serine/threonine phosphatase [Desulfuromonadales bacterium]